MISNRSSPVASDLGAQLRATAHEPDDDAATALRARLRHKMFGRGPSPAPSVPEAPAEPQIGVPSLSLPLLGWVVPAVGVVALACMSLWLHRARTERTPSPAPVRPERLHAAASIPEEVAAPSPVAPGPGLLEAAEHEGELAARSLAISVAVQAAWPDPSAPRRLDATEELAHRMRESGESLRALRVVRAVLDDLELQPGATLARARMLRCLAELYDELGRAPAAEAVRAEAGRLARADPSH